MHLDLSQIPFSRAYSYMAISDFPENFRGGDNTKGLYLRSIRAGSSAPYVAKIILIQDGKEIPYRYEANPFELKITGDTGSVSFCYAADDTILMKGMGQKIGLRLDFSLKGAAFDYVSKIPIPQKEYYLANCHKNKDRFFLSAQTGKISVFQTWHGSTSYPCSVEFSGEQEFLGVVKEVYTEWDAEEKIYNYENSVKKVDEEFTLFKESMPAVPERYRDAAVVASYVNWSGYVKKSGLLPRDSMYMSKNWMCNVWSWDHCFNAMALAYNNPQKAWDQFIIMFDLQDETGLIPDSINDSQIVWNFCKPPIHGWALSRIMEVMPLTIEQIREAYDKLSRWTNWWLNQRDRNENGLCEYNHGNDSGWDNATAFGHIPPVETPDLQAFLVLQMEILSDLAGKLHRKADAKEWSEKAREKMNRMLSCCFEGTRPKAVHVETQNEIETDSLLLYLPIILGKRLPPEIRAHLISVLKSDEFLTEYGYATEKPRSEKYESDGYWRGPIWAPSTMIILDGLYQCEEIELVRSVTEAFAKMIEKSGCAENFDALSGDGLRDRAYTWTSSAFLVMANRYLE